MKPGHMLLQFPFSITPASTPAKQPSKPPSAPLMIPKLGKKEPGIVEVTASEVLTEHKERETEKILIQEQSAESISSSPSSSIINVLAEEKGEIIEEGATGGTELQDDPESLRSDVPSESGLFNDADVDVDGSKVPSKASDEEETGEQVEEEPNPTEFPLPITPAIMRSTSTTPRVEHPKIIVSASPPPQTSSSSGIGAACRGS